MWEDRSRAGMLHQHQLLQCQAEPLSSGSGQLWAHGAHCSAHHFLPCQGSRLPQDKVLKSPSGADPAHQQQVRGRQGGFLWRKAAGAFAMPLIFSTRGMEVLKEKKQDKKTTLEYTAGSSGGNICPSAHTHREQAKASSACHRSTHGKLPSASAHSKPPGATPGPGSERDNGRKP